MLWHFLSFWQDCLSVGYDLWSNYPFIMGPCTVWYGCILLGKYCLYHLYFMRAPNLPGYVPVFQYLKPHLCCLILHLIFQNLFCPIFSLALWPYSLGKNFWVAAIVSSMWMWLHFLLKTWGFNWRKRNLWASKIPSTWAIVCISF